MGSTSNGFSPRSSIWDHPHIHGEHSRSSEPKPARSGSPPYTWGALHDEFQGVDRVGITPIYMGSTNIHLQNASFR